jgi:hypothetical protein
LTLEYAPDEDGDKGLGERAANRGGLNAYIDGAVVDPDMRRTKYRNNHPTNHAQIASKARLSACNHQSGISSP